MNILDKINALKSKLKHIINKVDGGSIIDRINTLRRKVSAVINKVQEGPISVEKLKKMLEENNDTVRFGYYTLEGRFRMFNATRNLSLIPGSYHPKTRGHRKNLRLFDKTANGWRSVATDTTSVYLYGKIGRAHV